MSETNVSIIKKFPEYIVGYGLSFPLAAMSDITITSLTISSVAIGFATNVYAGIATFFLIHTGIRMINAITGTRIQQAIITSESINRLANVFESEKQPKDLSSEG